MAWCLTAYNDPSRHLYGPFPTLERASSEALKLLSPEAKLAVAESMRRPNTLTPVYCDGSRHHSALFNVVPPAPPTPRVKHADTASPAPLPSAIFKLTEGKLRYFAAQLGITIPPQARNRAEIISYLSTQLDLT